MNEWVSDYLLSSAECFIHFLGFCGRSWCVVLLSEGFYQQVFKLKPWNHKKNRRNWLKRERKIDPGNVMYKCIGKKKKHWIAQWVMQGWHQFSLQNYLYLKNWIKRTVEKNMTVSPLVLYWERSYLHHFYDCCWELLSN